MTHETGAPPEDSDAPSTDGAALARLERFGGGKLLRDMIDLFLAAAPSRIDAARAGTSAGDAAAAEMALHSLKSSAAQLGAPRMQQLCARGEAAARAGDLGVVGPLVAQLDLEWAHVREWLADAREGGRT